MSYLKNMFTHLQCHSNYSLLRGADKVEILLDKAKSLGMDCLALTDTDALYGAIPFYKAAQERGIKPIIGTEICDGKSKAVLLAANSKGYSNICKIISDKKLTTNFNLSNSIMRDRDGVIVLSSSVKLLEELLENGSRENIFIKLSRYSKKSSRLQERLAKISKKTQLPLVATNNVHFSQAKGFLIHRVLSAVRELCTVKTLKKRDIVHSQSYLKPYEEMRILFDDVPEALSNTELIAQKCEFEFGLGKPKYPKFETPHNICAYEYLEKLCVQGAFKRYGRCDGRIRERLDYELSVIRDLNLCEYFLIVWDINEFARAEKIPSVGRGSAADSLVCYLLFITNVDPIAHDLFFERFLNHERQDNPDIDLDFCWRRRDKVLDYVYRKYGDDRVAMISTHVTFSGRSALREVTKALGIPIGEIEKYIENLPFWGGVEGIERAKQKIPECRNIPIDREPLKTIYEIAKYVDGYPRHLSIHPGGIVVSPTPITDFIPLERATKGLVVTQFDMYPVEDMGLLKIDLLGQRSLSVIDDTCRALSEKRGIVIDYGKTDPTKDEKTKTLIKNGETIGCFYVESPGMRLLLKKLKCNTFEGLVAASSIIRPGVSESGMMREYIERYNGLKSVNYLHPSMERNLKATLGVMIYQEDVIRVANDFAGMSFGQADKLRKCMSKKRDWEDMAKYKETFMKGARTRGAKESIAQEIWRQIESFAGYAFCKAHSASYAQISYQAAYLKAHYPAEFMAAVISNGGGFYHTWEYVEEARRMGIQICLPDINRSEKHFKGSKGRMRVGFFHVRSLRSKIIDEILEERKRGYYVSLTDFLKRTDTHKKETENLIKCGVFDCFEFSRPELLWKLEIYFKKKLKKTDIEEGTLELPLRYGEFERSKRILPRIKDYSLKAKLKFEKEILDFTGSAHPLDLYLPITDNRSPITESDHIVKGKEIPHNIGKEIDVIGWIVTSKRTKTKKGDQMKFLTMEDKTASFEVTLFPDAYRKYGNVLYDRGPYLVEGRVEDEFGGITITVKSLRRIQ